MQDTGALNGWLLGVVIGPGTPFVIVTLGPSIDPQHARAGRATRPPHSKA